MAMMISRVSRVKSSHPYLENDPSSSLVSHRLRISPWLRFRSSTFPFSRKRTTTSVLKFRNAKCRGVLPRFSSAGLRTGGPLRVSGRSLLVNGLRPLSTSREATSGLGFRAAICNAVSRSASLRISISAPHSSNNAVTAWLGFRAAMRRSFRVLDAPSNNRSSATSGFRLKLA